MRLTVLLILAVAGATCALNIPSIPSPLSARGIRASNDKSRSDESSSGSSSEENQNTGEIAQELAQRLAEDILNAAQGAGSLVLLPVKLGTSVFNILVNDIGSVLGRVLQPGSPSAPELAVKLAASVVRDVERLALTGGALLLNPIKLKARLVEIIAHDVAQVLDDVQDRVAGQQQQSGSAEDNRHSSRPPRPTPSRGPRPSSSPSTSPNPTRPTTSSTPRPTTSSTPRPTTSTTPSTTTSTTPSTTTIVTVPSSTDDSLGDDSDGDSLGNDSDVDSQGNHSAGDSVN